MYHYKDGIKVAFNCERCDTVMPVKDMYKHKCNPALRIKATLEKVDKERSKNALS